MIIRNNREAELMADLFSYNSKRVANLIEDTFVYVLRKFFAEDNTYTYADSQEQNPEEEPPEDETKIYINSEYAIKDYQNEAIPIIIVGNVVYDMNFTATLGNNFFQPYRAHHSQQITGDPDPVIGTQHVTMIPFSCAITFLGQNEAEIEMIAELLVNYFAVILNQTFACFGFDITNVRFGGPVPRSNYPIRNYYCTLSLNGFVNAYQINVSENDKALFDKFITELTIVK
jgi:hypothetical protein